MSVSTLHDFKAFGLPAQAIWDGAWESVEANVEAAESDILDALRTAGNEVPIPAASWSPGMKRRACTIAGYQFLRVRGWQPQADEDNEFVKEYVRCVEWIEKVASGQIKPLPENSAGETIDGDATTEPTGAGVSSEPRRGWGATWP